MPIRRAVRSPTLTRVARRLPLILAIIYVLTFLLAWVAPGNPFQSGEKNMDPAVEKMLRIDAPLSQGDSACALPFPGRRRGCSGGTRHAPRIAAVARRLFSQFPLDRKIRLIGVSAGDLHRDGDDPQQLALFEPSNQNEKLSHTVDEIKQKFGADSVRRGSQLL